MESVQSQDGLNLVVTVKGKHYLFELTESGCKYSSVENGIIVAALDPEQMETLTASIHSKLSPQLLKLMGTIEEKDYKSLLAEAKKPMVAGVKAWAHISDADKVDGHGARQDVLNTQVNRDGAKMDIASAVLLAHLVPAIKHSTGVQVTQLREEELAVIKGKAHITGKEVTPAMTYIEIER
ncbi:MAG: hypothetical protein ACHP6I_02690 [Rickettsiales bacterium]